MGSTTSKLRKHIEKGDEHVAVDLYTKSSDFKRTKFNINLPINESMDTYMHLCAKNGMESLLKLFLNGNNGNPRKLNRKKQNVLHKACEGTDDERQLKCLMVLIEWRDCVSNERIDINAKDEDDNTAMHYAAMNNLRKCVQVLSDNGAQLFIENKEKLTSCDLAEKYGQKEIALFLESKMIFSDPDKHEQEENEQEELLDTPEPKYGLRIQDLQEEKDKLLVETADMLQCSIFTAEILLKKHLWSKEALLQSWIDDSIKCCEQCGVNVPLNIIQENGSSNSSFSEPKGDKRTFRECGICFQTICSKEKPIQIPCEHAFCKSCWKNYLTVKIEDGSVGEIFCPEVDCYTIIPHEITEKLVSRETAFKYLQFDIKAFVETNPSIKWCPHPGCTMAIRDPLFNQNMYLAENKIDRKEFSKSVDCGNGHYYCWDCLQDGHEPASCKNWNDWFEKTRYTKPEDLCEANEKEECSANYLWLVTNSKKCPNGNCNAPIQKNEGCNHVKCSKCKHDFCWVCLEPWKKHSSLTGGYFQCNRYEVSKKVAESEKSRINEAEEAHLKTIEINRFVHYYTRFKNHEHSYKLEEPLLKIAKAKYELLTAQLGRNSEFISSNDIDVKIFPTTSDKATAGAGLYKDYEEDEDSSSSEHLFIEDAIKELLKARKILRSSYVYGYYLDSNMSHKKFIFELIQTEFEECTENLSQIVARPYLKTPKHKIIKRTKLLKRKRFEFLDTITKGLVLPDTPPILKRYSKKRWKYLLKDDVEIDEDYKNIIGLSIKQLNPKDPWIIDKNGRHTNLLAVLDEWPVFEELLENILQPSKNQGICMKRECTNVKAVNSANGTLFDYCSIKCMKTDNKNGFKRLSSRRKNYRKRGDSFDFGSGVGATGGADSGSNTSSFLTDLNDAAFESDLQRAIEMSKLQHARELNVKLKLTSDDDIVHNERDEFENDLQLAIESSLKANDQQRIPRKTMPYNSIFVTQDNNLGTLIRNMDEIIFDDEDDDDSSDDAIKIYPKNENDVILKQRTTNVNTKINVKLKGFELKSKEFGDEIVTSNGCAASSVTGSSDCKESALHNF